MVGKGTLGQFCALGFAGRIVSGMLIEAFVLVGVGMAAKYFVAMPYSDPPRRNLQQGGHFVKRQHACLA